MKPRRRSRAVRPLLFALTLLLPALPSAAQTAAQSAGSASVKKPWYENILFKGFVQLDAVFPEGNATQGPNSNFRIRRARPTFIATLDPLTRVQVQFDLSTPKSGGGSSNVTVTDTFAERRIPRVAVVQFGQLLLPFGHEVHEDNAALRSPLELSFAAEQIILSERDLGLFVRVDGEEYHPVHWELGMVNGQGVRTADANANKTLAGRVTFGNQNMRIGASGILGSYRVGAKDWDRHVLGLEFRTDFSKALNLEGEFYNVRFVDSLAAPTKQARYNGGYLLFETWVGPLKSIPFVRYQRTYGDLDYQSWDLGWRYQYTPTQRVTAQYDIVKGSGRNQFGLRWQLAF